MNNGLIVPPRQGIIIGNVASTTVWVRWVSSDNYYGVVDLRDVTLKGDGSQAFYIDTQSNLTGLLLPALAQPLVTGKVTIWTCAKLSGPLDLSCFTKATSFEVAINNLVTSVALPTATTITTAGLIVRTSAALTTITNLAGCLRVNSQVINLSANALTAATIAQILVDCVASGKVSCNLNINGGTNAAPPGDMAVSGALSPDVTGTFTRTTNVNSRPCWVKDVGGTMYYIGWDGTNAWNLSTSPGDPTPASAYWTVTQANPWGTYTAVAPATGNATVAGTANGSGQNGYGNLQTLATLGGGAWTLAWVW